MYHELFQSKKDRLMVKAFEWESRNLGTAFTSLLTERQLLLCLIFEVCKMCWLPAHKSPWSKYTVLYMGVGHQLETEADGEEKEGYEVWQ